MLPISCMKLLGDKNVLDYETMSLTHLTFKALFLCRIIITAVYGVNNMLVLLKIWSLHRVPQFE